MDITDILLGITYLFAGAVIVVAVLSLFDENEQWLS